MQLEGYPPPPLLAVVSGIITYDGAGNHWGESTMNLDIFGSGPPGTFTGTLNARRGSEQYQAMNSSMANW